MPAQPRMKFLKIVNQEADRLTSLIEDVLEISRIESGRVELRFELYTLEDVIEKLKTAGADCISCRMLWR